MPFNQPYKDKPLVSIVVCTYNRADLLRITLDSLPGLPGIEKAEIVIVDNNSTDHTRSVAEQFAERQTGKLEVRYRFERSQGLSVARNTGVQAARGEIVAFLDDDAIPCPTWLSTICVVFSGRRDVDALGGIIRPNFETHRPDWLIPALELPYTIVNLGDAPRAYPAGLHPYGANMAMRKSFMESHPFPAGLGRKGQLLLSGEESWLFDKMKKEGKTFLYHPDMAVDHFIPAGRLTKEWILQRYYYQGISNGLMRQGFGGKLFQLGMVAARMVYIAADSLLARSEGRKLLIQCRLESIRGTLYMLRRRENMPSTR